MNDRHDKTSEATSKTSIRICGAALTYYGDERGWRKYDWLRRKFMRGVRRV